MLHCVTVQRIEQLTIEPMQVDWQIIIWSVFLQSSSMSELWQNRASEIYQQKISEAEYRHRIEHADRVIISINC